MKNKPLIYLDSCFFIAIFKKEEGRYQVCSRIIEEANNGMVQPLISTLVIAEARKISDSSIPDELFMSPFIWKYSLDTYMSIRTKETLIRLPTLKLADAIHLTKAVEAKSDYYFTYDDQLLKKTENISLGKLKIVKPFFPLESDGPIQLPLPFQD